jgi:hypothetical protein
VKIRIAAAAAIVTGFILGILRSRRTRLRVVAPDGSTVRPRTTAARSGLGAKARAVVVLASLRLRDAVAGLGGWRNGEEATDALVIEMTADLAAAINERTSQAV